MTAETYAIQCIYMHCIAYICDTYMHQKTPCSSSIVHDCGGGGWYSKHVVLAVELKTLQRGRQTIFAIATYRHWVPPVLKFKTVGPPGIWLLATALWAFLGGITSFL
jgi:hypothetical protein